jgi:hypothetical protein
VPGATIAWLNFNTPVRYRLWEQFAYVDLPGR